MKKIIFVLFGFMLAPICPGQQEKLAKFSSQPNDWFSRFEFRALIAKDPRRIRHVVVIVSEQLEKIEEQILDERWRGFHDHEEIGIVCIAFNYQRALPKGSDPKAKPLYQQKPAEAFALLKKQLDKLVTESYPQADGYGYFANGRAFEVVKQFLKTSPREVKFWIAEDERWFIPKEWKKLPEGLVINRKKENLAKMLEAQVQNAANGSKVLFVSSLTEDASAVNKLTKGYIELLVSNDRMRPTVCDLLSEQEIRANSRTAAKFKTRLPDIGILSMWSSANAMVDEDRLAEVVEERIETGIKTQPALTLYLKLPPGYDRGNPPKGVLCIVTWMQDERSLKELILHGSYREDLLKWAESKGMAVVTWNTATLWKSGVSQEELDRKSARGHDDNFDQMASAWDKGMRRLVTKYKLSPNGYFLYGNSRGSHWGHRLALRRPDRFSAVHINVANSYDIPTGAAKNILWLVTTGELDSGYQASMRFYRQCIGLGYPSILKAGPNMGHNETEEIRKLGMTFFNYATTLKERICPEHQPNTEESKKIADLMRNDLRNAEFFGDFINQEVYAVKKGDWIPVEQRIPLASTKIAEDWSPVINR